MTTDIQSNGSRWAGEKPATIGQLLDVLAKHPLDPTFENFGNFILREPDLVNGGKLIGMTRFFGNFYRLSHVFNIDTDEPETIAKLKQAIRANQLTPGYAEAREATKREREATKREREATKRAIARHRKRDLQAKRAAARVVLGL